MLATSYKPIKLLRCSQRVNIACNPYSSSVVARAADWPKIDASGKAEPLPPIAPEDPEDTEPSLGEAIQRTLLLGVLFAGWCGLTVLYCASFSGVPRMQRV
jgi:hypothetical protein